MNRTNWARPIVRYSEARKDRKAIERRPKADGKMRELSTERLTIKKLTGLDKARLIQLIGDPRVSETLSNVPYPYTDQDAEYWIRIVHSSEFNFNIFSDGLLIGGLGLTPQSDDSCELGYWLGFDYWGKGYATEACNALLDYASAETCFRQVRANVMRVIRLLLTSLKKSG